MEDYVKLSAAMVEFVQHGRGHDEMKRRVLLLKLHAETLHAVFEILERAGLTADGTELADAKEATKQ